MANGISEEKSVNQSTQTTTTQTNLRSLHKFIQFNLIIKTKTTASKEPPEIVAQRCSSFRTLLLIYIFSGIDINTHCDIAIESVSGKIVTGQVIE